MIPAPFTYQRASSVDEALDLAAQGGEDAKFLAGGHSLLPLMKLRLAVPEILVDIGRLGELSFIRDDGSHIAVGALTSHDEVARSGLLASELPLLAHAAGQVGDPQVRHRGTIGGSLAHADPASDLPAVTLTLAATLCTRDVAQGVSGGQSGGLMHGPTFMGNPLACSVALASLDLLERNDFHAQTARIESELRVGLAPAMDLDCVLDVRTLGAVGVIQLTGPADVAAIGAAALERGVWVRPFRDLVYTMPPYVSTTEDIAAITSALVGAVTDIHG